MNRTTYKLASLFVFSAITLAASSQAGAGAVAVRAPQIVRVPAYRFLLTLPTGWRQIPLSASEINALEAQWSKSNPSLAAVLGSEIHQVMAQHIIKVFAMNLAAASQGIAENLTASVLPGTVAPGTLDVEAKLAGEGLGGKDLSVVKLVVANVPAVRISLEASDNLANGTHLELRLTQFYFSHFGFTYIVTLTTAANAANIALADATMTTFHWLPSPA